LVVCADEPATSSPEAQRFEEAKRRRDQEALRFEAEKRRRQQEAIRKQQDAISTYVWSAKYRIVQAWKDWHSPANGKLLITKIKLTLDTDGKTFACKVVTPSGSEPEDKSVEECVNSLALTALPPGPRTLDLFWTFMSDGTMNMVEYSDSPEANAYYTNLVGGILSGTSPLPMRMIPSNGVIPMASPNTPLLRPTGGGDGARTDDRMNGRPSVAGQANVDFGPYMADLQRRIKRAWFPPKGHEQDRVVVAFKVHQGGELSNLRVDHSSGVVISDQAALYAVQQASPFRPLPAGANDDVDIQFTFDYNVFNGGGHATFRSF